MSLCSLFSFSLSGPVVLLSIVLFSGRVSVHPSLHT